MEKVNKYSVLIVDDDKMDIMAMTHILSPDYTVYALKEGSGAVEKAEDIAPDVILLDIVMPEMDGFEVIAALKKSVRARSIPVIFITGHEEPDYEERGLRLGAVDYIIKPFKSDIVKLRIQNQIKIISQMDLIIEKELAEKSNRAQFEFLARMSHEMLTPMNAIMGMTQIAKRSGELCEISECLDEIDSSSCHLKTLIHNLLEISGGKDKKPELSNAPFSFSAVFRKLLSAVIQDIETKSQKFTYELDPMIPMLIIGDKVRLSQVISNLLSNAVKFTQANGGIHFSARVVEESGKVIMLLIEVTDDGIGISEEKQQEMFNVFAQVDSSTTARQEGVGLGLAVSKQIIELMGGRIWVESEPGKGSKFSFTCKLSVV